jgi:hypothetical protein
MVPRTAARLWFTLSPGGGIAGAVQGLNADGFFQTSHYQQDINISIKLIKLHLQINFLYLIIKLN